MKFILTTGCDTWYKKNEFHIVENHYQHENGLNYFRLIKPVPGYYNETPINNYLIPYFHGKIIKNNQLTLF